MDLPTAGCLLSGLIESGGGLMLPSFLEGTEFAAHSVLMEITLKDLEKGVGKLRRSPRLVASRVGEVRILCEKIGAEHSEDSKFLSNLKLRIPSCSSLVR